MELGPRALGARSILADARSPRMQRILNLKVKYRESFRPFAPSVISLPMKQRNASSGVHAIGSPRTDAEEVALGGADRPAPMFGDTGGRSAYRDCPDRARTDKLNAPRSEIPAVTHVDYSARIQTVHRETNPRYHALLTRFQALTGCPVLVNTSFNDCLAIGNFFLHTRQTRIPPCASTTGIGSTPIEPALFVRLQGKPLR
jgi:carbamoyltransferase